MNLEENINTSEDGYGSIDKSSKNSDSVVNNINNNNRKARWMMDGLNAVGFSLFGAVMKKNTNTDMHTALFSSNDDLEGGVSSSSQQQQQKQHQSQELDWEKISVIPLVLSRTVRPRGS